MPVKLASSEHFMYVFLFSGNYELQNTCVLMYHSSKWFAVSNPITSCVPTILRKPSWGNWENLACSVNGISTR